MSAVGELAERYGFVAANRLDVDESRWSRASETHVVFVVAQHELHRLPGEVALLRQFEWDLRTAREWLEDEALDGRIIRVGRIEVRPHSGFYDEEAVQSGDGFVSLSRPEAQDLHSPEEWPVLDEEPEVGE